MFDFDIGIHVDGCFERLKTTLESLSRNADVRSVLLLVPPEWKELNWSLFAPCRVIRVKRAGGASAFNALLEHGPMPGVVFLESGTRVPGECLSRLVNTIAGDVALAGPSSNLTWNEQRQRGAPAANADSDRIDAYALRVAARYGDSSQELLPLHSLADFCFAAARQALFNLGGADDAYDPGPCWEIDLNVRLHRAGWKSLWVKGAYAHRGEISLRRRSDEREFFLANKRRFQERFCGGKLRGEKVDDCSCCLGDACSEFAPKQGIMPALGVSLMLRRPLASVPELPLVSCILPTRDRPAFVMEALRGFLNQDYPHRELIVVDDGDAPIANLIPADDRIRYFHMTSRQSLGHKRNFACEQARGEFIAHIDDDDVYPPDRLSTQARALLAQGAAVCGTSSLYFFDPITERGWLYTYPRRGWIAGATLFYRRSYWSRHPFAALQVGEDWRFLEGLRGPDDLVDLADPRLCIATIHCRNTSPKQIEAPLWMDLPPNAMALHVDGRARLALRAAAMGSAPELPLVSCIMPTSDRVEFVDLAIRKFQAQDYPHKELIVLDAGGLAAAGVRRDLPAVRYTRLNGDRRLTIGEMRNRACSLAHGGIICIWDDDDWYAPERLRYQVLPILYGEADLTGLRCGHLLCLPSAEVWTVDDTVHRRMFESDVAGGTIAFLRKVWAEVRFPHIDLAEDAALIRIARARGYRLKQIEKHDLFAYVRHSRNTWQFEPGTFYDAQAWSRTELPPGFGREMLRDHLEAYRSWVRRIGDSA